jgi:transcriptional regulator with XRE-family HTH domain
MKERFKSLLESLAEMVSNSFKSTQQEPLPDDACKDLPKNFGYEIGSLRVAKDLRHWELAYLTGIPALNLQAIELGKEVPTEEMVKSLAKELKTDEEALLQLWRSSCEQPVTTTAPTEPKISREAEEHKFFWG